MASPVLAPQPLTDREFRDAFPNSRKVHVSTPHGIQVPMREISLSGGGPPLRVYDTSGPQGHDVCEGLPLLRSAWIRARDVAQVDQPRVANMPGGLQREALRGRTPVTQLY